MRLLKAYSQVGAQELRLEFRRHRSAVPQCLDSRPFRDGGHGKRSAQAGRDAPIRKLAHIIPSTCHDYEQQTPRLAAGQWCFRLPREISWTSAQGSLTSNAQSVHPD